MESSKPFRIAVIMGGSCTVPKKTDVTDEFGVTDLVGFSCGSKAELQAPGVPDSYRQSYPTKWNLIDQVTIVAPPTGAATPSVVIIDSTGNSVSYYNKDNGIKMAGVVLDQGMTQQQLCLSLF